MYSVVLKLQEEIRKQEGKQNPYVHIDDKQDPDYFNNLVQLQFYYVYGLCSYIFLNFRVSPHNRRAVYMTGMREGDSSDFEFLLNRFRQSNFANDQLEMLRGMGASSDPNLLMR